MHRTDVAPGGQPLVQFDLRGIREAALSLKMNPQTGLHAEHKSILDFSPFYIFVVSIIFFIKNTVCFMSTICRHRNFFHFFLQA